MAKIALGSSREATQPDCIQALVVEFIATFLFVFVGVASSMLTGIYICIMCTPLMYNKHNAIIFDSLLCNREAWWGCTSGIVCCGRGTCTGGGRHDLRRTHLRWPPEPRRDYRSPRRWPHHRVPFHPVLD